MRAAISLLVLTLIAAPAAADSKVPRVGVVIGFAFEVDAATAESIGGALSAALVKRLKVDATGGAEVTRRLPDGGLPDECVSTPACIADVAQRLGADQLLFLGVVRAGGDYQIDTTFVDVESGAQAARPRLKLTDPAKATEPFAAAAERYLPDAEVRGSGNQTIIVGGAERHRPIKKSVWIIGGAGVGAMIGGGILGLTAKSMFDKCKATPGSCDRDDEDRLRTRNLIADITVGVGVAAVVTAIVLYAKTPVETLPVTPSVTPVEGGVVLALDGRF